MYVLDSGIRADHVEFTGRIAAGADFTGSGLADCTGHGTHVAGTIGGTTYGVTKQVTIVPVRVFDCAGSATTFTLLSGFDWIVQHHQARRRSSTTAVPAS